MNLRFPFWLGACGIMFASRLASAQERDAGPPATAEVVGSSEAGTPPAEEAMPMLSGEVVGKGPAAAPTSRVPETSAVRSSDERLYTTQRRLGLLLSGAHGYGLGLRYRASRFTVDVTAAFRPVFTTYSVKPDEVPEFRLLGGFEFAIAPSVMVYRAGPKTELGITAG